MYGHLNYKIPESKGKKYGDNTQNLPDNKVLYNALVKNNYLEWILSNELYVADQTSLDIHDEYLDNYSKKQDLKKQKPIK